MMELRKAQRTAKKLRIAIQGPSGSGKTYTSLRIASQFTDKIAVIDTENHSAEAFAGLPGINDFFVITLDPPYSVDKYRDALKACADHGIEFVIIDSLSHAWAGEGGILDSVEEAKKRNQSGNSFTAWHKGTKDQNSFMQSILNSPFHIISTLRVKTEYIIEKNEKGKDAPRKIGMAPIQRDGVEYEFDCVVNMTLDHDVLVEKTRFVSIDQKVYPRNDFSIATDIIEYMRGLPETPAHTPQDTQKDELYDRLKNTMYDGIIEQQEIIDYLAELGVKSFKQLSIDDAKDTVLYFEKLRIERKNDNANH